MHLYWNSVLQSAELDSAADFRAAASTGKQGFGDGRTAGKPHGSETNVLVELAVRTTREGCATGKDDRSRRR